MGCTASLKQDENNSLAIGAGLDVSKQQLADYLNSSDKAVLQLQDKVKQLVNELEGAEPLSLVDSDLISSLEASLPELGMSNTSVTTLLAQSSVVEVENDGSKTGLGENNVLKLDRLSEKHRSALIELKKQVELLVKEFEQVTKSSVADYQDPQLRKAEVDQQGEVPVLDSEPSNAEIEQQEENPILDPGSSETGTDQQDALPDLDPDPSKADVDKQQENPVLDLESGETDVNQQNENIVPDCELSKAGIEQQAKVPVLDSELSKTESDQQSGNQVLDPQISRAEFNQQGELLVLEKIDFAENFVQPTESRITFDTLRTILNPNDQEPEFKVHNGRRGVKDHDHHHRQIKAHDKFKPYHRPRVAGPPSFSQLQMRPACQVGVLDYIDWTICQLEAMTAKDRKPAEATKSRSTVQKEAVVKKRSANKIPESKPSGRRAKIVDFDSYAANVRAPVQSSEGLSLNFHEGVSPAEDEICPLETSDATPSGEASSSDSLKDAGADLKGSRIVGLRSSNTSLIADGPVVVNTTENASTCEEEPLQEGVEEEPEKPSTSLVTEKVPNENKKGSRSIATSTLRRRKRNRSGDEYSYEASQSFHEELHPKSTVGTNTKPRKKKKGGDKDMQQVAKLFEKDILPKIEEQLERLRDVLRRDQQHVPG